MRQNVIRRRRSNSSLAWLEPFEPRILLAQFDVTNTLDSGAGSLRQAILDANSTPGLDTIAFSITPGGSQTISPTTALPIVTDPVIIDGTTQPLFAGTPLITIDGINTLDSSGLRISSGNSTVKAIRITRFTSNGLALDTAGGNVVEGNEFSGNGGDGVRIASSNNRIGGTSAAQRNIISGNGSDGVRITGTGSANFVQGNWIGLNANGAALGNQENGVTLFTADNVIGGDVAGAGNVISTNGDHGIEISGSSAGGNRVQGNLIGTNVAGSAALGNGPPGGSGSAGVRVNGASNALIGGTTAAARNVIAATSGDGVRIEGLGAGGNVVQGNFTGTNAAGTAALPNTNDGVQIRSGANTIGGTQPGAGNLISGNSDDGIDLRNDAAGNIIQGNFIGTQANGTSALGNASDGIEIHGINTTVGGAVAAARNVIAANGSDGIDIEADLNGPATGTIIQGNAIGVAANGAALGNTSHGVHIKSGGSTTVGGATSATGNVIANNGLDGVFVLDSSANTIRFNSITSNGGLGIDLGPDGMTPNDDGDGDIGGNDLQNFPVITAATTASVQVSLNSTPNTQFTIDVYSNAAADASGFGEGAMHVGSAMLTTDGSGNAAGSISVGNVVQGQFLSATATNPAGSTSEFSQSVAVGADTIPPQVVESNFLFDGSTLPSPPHRLVYTFSENVSASLSPADLLLENLTTGTSVPTANIAVSYNTAANTATFTFSGFSNGILPDGRYRATLLAGGVTDPSGNPLPANHVSQFFVLSGDANHDGRVNLVDFNVLAANFGQSGRIFSQGDFNYDGVVNLLDFNILAARFGTVLAGPDEGLFR